MSVLIHPAITMKAMDPAINMKAMISVPAGVIKDFILNSNTPSPKAISKLNLDTPTPPRKRTPSPDLPNNHSSLPFEKSDSEEVTNGEIDKVEEEDNHSEQEKSNTSTTEKENFGTSTTEKENFGFCSSITVTSDAPLTNGSKRPNEDEEPKQDLKKVRYFGEEKSKDIETTVKDLNNSHETEPKSITEDLDDIMCLSSTSITVKKSADIEPLKNDTEKAESPPASPVPKVNSSLETKPPQTPKSDIKRASPTFSSDLEVIEEKSNLISKVKKLSRKELEKLILTLFSEKILYQFELGRQKALSEKLENTLEVNRKKTVQFHKEIEDLRKVTNRLAQEHASRKGQYVAPTRIRRSVGIQAAPHIINKGLLHAQGNNSAVKTIAPRSHGSVVRNLNSSQPVGYHNKALSSNCGNGILTSGNVGMSTQTTVVRSHAVATSQALNTNVPIGAVAHPTGAIGTVRPAAGGQMLMMSQAPQGVMQAIPRPKTAGRTPIGRSPNILPAPGTLVKVPVTAGTTQLLAIPQTGGVVLLPPNASAATLVVSQVSGVQTVNSPVVAQARIGTLSPRVIGNSFRPITTPTMTSSPSQQKHPAPLPKTQAQQVAGSNKKLPPQPSLRLSHKDNSIVLSWTMSKTEDHETIASYQLYAYQEGTAPPCWTLWKKVGSVKALELPMACTLTQFMPGHMYHFAVRAVDIKSRLGPFSEPRSIRLEKK